MTTEEKAKAYDGNYKTYTELINRLEGVKDAIKNQNYGIAMDILCKPYPEYQITTSTELKESEDERIRKELLAWLKSRDGQTLPIDRYNVAVAWLEKQGERKTFDYEKAHIQQNDFVPKSALEAIKGEKLDNQNCIKSADKVEPKFHKGDWIIHQGTENIYQVVAVIDNQYQLKYGDNYTVQKCTDVDRCARLWDITKDAKDGAVLKEGSCIFIIQKLNDNNTAKTYCTLYNDGDFDDGTTLYFDIDSTKPATKEQRDQLERAMTNAGYRWNKEELKLEKI